MNRSTRILTFALALLLGAVLAWVALPRWQLHRALTQITSELPQLREEGWTWFALPMDREQTPRADEHLPALHRALNAASDCALLEGGERLRSMQLWNWDNQPHRLTLRELALRADTNEDDQRLVLEEMARAPLAMRTGEVLPIFRALLAAEHSGIRERALSVVIGWLGRGRAGNLTLDHAPDHDAHLRRMLRLVHTWAGVSIDADALAATIESNELSRDELEAAVLQLLRAHPEELPAVIASMAEADDRADIALAYLLRFSEAPEARSVLEHLAERTDSAARFAVQAIDPERDQAEALRIVSDRAEPMWRRRLAAWRCAELDPHLLHELLAADPADSDGSVYATALLAEHHLPRDDAKDLAELWIRDLRDDRKRAGALLAALLGEHAGLVREALEASTEPRVRSVLRVALWALREPYSESPAEFAHRTLHANDRDDFNPDVALCMLLAGHLPLVEHLVSPPLLDEANIRLSVQQRAMLIERFVPQWHEAVGRPSGGDARAIRLHFDSLRAMWMLDYRRLELP